MTEKETKDYYTAAINKMTAQNATYYLGEMQRLKRLAIKTQKAKKAVILNDWKIDKDLVEMLYALRIIKDRYDKQPAYIVYKPIHQTDSRYKGFCWARIIDDLQSVINRPIA